MEKVKITIIGAGVVGLAIAAELSKKHQDIVLVEKHDSFGQETSSRNSEIIHAGLYYAKDSLKAKLCVEGKQLLYEFCEINNVPCARLGKIIVAADESEMALLDELAQKARNNGVNELSRLNQKQTNEFEPAVKAFASLFSPSTGIIDSHSLMKCLEQKAKSNGVMISYGSEVKGIRKTGSGYQVNIGDEYGFDTEILVNSAGLSSDKIASLAGIDVDKNRYKLHYCKGEYFAYTKPSFVKHLVYPVPEKGLKGLGIHTVSDLAGSLKFGPNAEYVDKIDYKVDLGHRELFFNSARKLFPRIKIDDLQPDQAGIRPKLQGQGEVIRDFVITDEARSGLPGFIDLIGIESPGLTACLAIGRQVASLIA